jgi:hypothetical protein
MSIKDKNAMEYAFQGKYFTVKFNSKVIENNYIMLVILEFIIKLLHYQIALSYMLKRRSI